MDESGFVRALQTAIAAGDYEGLPERIDRESDYGYTFPFVDGGGPLPEVVFSGLLELLREPGFLAAEDSHRILYFFRWNWSILTPEQRERLRDTLRAAYPEYRDLRARFETSELFGEYFAGEKALEDLLAFMNAERPDLRQLAPTGLDHLVRQTARPDLAARALARLEEARTDPDPDVRDEAEESFWRIQTWQEGRAESEEQTALIGPITSESRWDEAVFARVLQITTARENYMVLAEWVEQECRASFFSQLSGAPPMSELIFSGMLGLLDRRGFLEGPNSNRVLDFFGGDCSNLTPEQLKRLRKSLRKALPAFATLDARSAAAKLLAERFRDDLTLKDSLTLMKDEDREIREAIPEALEKLATQDARPDIAERAAAGLEEARTDPDPEVRREVELALDRIRIYRDAVARLGTEEAAE